MEAENSPETSTTIQKSTSCDVLDEWCLQHSYYAIIADCSMIKFSNVLQHKGTDVDIPIWYCWFMALLIV